MKEDRKNRLMPNGIPKYVRCYDNGGTEVEEGTVDRYTVCYTGNYRKRNVFGVMDWFQYVGMSGSPYHPQGFCQHGENETQIDTKNGWSISIGRKNHLGRRIRFEDLPEDCKKVVIGDYKAIWSL